VSAIEELVRSSLHERAGGEVDAAALVDATTRRGRARVRRRWVNRSLVAVVVVAVTAGTVLMGNRSWTGGGPWRLAPGVGASADLPRLPGVPGARETPGRVGADPTVLHFDAPTLIAGSRHHSWSSGPGYEQLGVALERGDLAYVTMGPEMAVLDEVEREGGPGAVLFERPVGGLWLRVETSTHELAREVAAAVDLDHSQRCVLPFTLGALPSGARLTECSVGFIGGRYVEGGVRLASPAGATMEVQAQYEPRYGAKRANHSAGGRPAYLYPGVDEVELLGYPGLYLSARIGKANGGFEVEDADLVLAAVTVATDFDNMDTWPRSVVRG
jgi:hypothetical protein